MGLAAKVDEDLKKGISPEDALARLAGRLDQWCAGMTQRIERLEEVVNLDRQNLNEVDRSVRQTWEALDDRVKRLEGADKQQPHQLGQ